MNAEIMNIAPRLAETKPAKPPRTRKQRADTPAPAAAPKVSRKAQVAAKEMQGQRWSAGLLGGVATIITGLSLSHLAHGIEIITHPDYAWESWAMAVGIDVGMIATEVASLTASEQVQKDTRWYSAGMIAGTLGLSAAMNSFAFASQASSLPFQIAGVVFGVAVPCAIYALARQAAAHYLDAHKRS
jgi:hypothetical protein